MLTGSRSNNFQELWPRLLGLGVVLLAAVSLVACGAIGSPCEFDSDCRGDSLCVEKICTASCAGDKDCEATGESCQAFLRPGDEDPVNVCIAPRDVNNDRAECQTDQECKSFYDDVLAICGINQRCVIPVDVPGPLLARAILIRDVTVVRPDEEGEVGADIAAVFVRDATGQIVGFGDTLDFVGASERASDDGHLDGSAPELSEGGQCLAVSEHDLELTSLGGVGGYYLIGFVDDLGAPLVLEPGSTIVVIEWGSACRDEPGDDDEYDVFLCFASGAEDIDVEEHCEQRLETRASGYGEFVVTAAP